MLIAVAAIGLDLFMHWIVTWATIPPWMMLVLELIEKGLFVLDAVTFVTYVLVTAKDFVQSLF